MEIVSIAIAVLFSFYVICRFGWLGILGLVALFVIVCAMGNSQQADNNGDVKHGQQ